MSQNFTVLFGNVGRRHRGNTTRVDSDALEALYRAAPDERAVVALCEVNEGDDNDELALAKRIFRGWRFYFTTTREPVALSPDWGTARSRVQWINDSSVKHWSPRRSINVLHLPDTSVSGIFGHYAAGAYHGDRPASARGELRQSWDNMFQVHHKIERRLHSIDRDVFWMMDTNHLSMPAVVKGERTVLHDRTDWMRVLPAKGREATFNQLPKIDFHIDSHDGLRVRGRFEGFEREWHATEQVA